MKLVDAREIPRSRSSLGTTLFDRRKVILWVDFRRET